MTNYPIQYEMTRDGAFHSGFAADDDAALAIIRAEMIEGGFDEEDLPTKTILSSVQASHAMQDRDKLAGYWREEIAAGYASLEQVWGGWVVMVETWVVNF